MTQNGFSLKVVIPLLIIVTTAFIVAFGAVIGGLFWQWEQVGQVMEQETPTAQDPNPDDEAAPQIAPPLD